MPFGNESMTVKEHRSYLSSEQALADYAELLKDLKRNDSRLEKSPVIAFGGSYGGMLAAWFRMKYPHVVQGAIAASAPVVQFPGYTPCNVFNDIIQKVFQTATPNGQCDDRFGKAFQLLKAASNDPTASKILSSIWHLCTPLTNAKDVQGMIDYLLDLFGNVAMVNYPYPADFIMDLPGNPVKAMCDAMDALPGHNIVDALYAGFQVAFNHTGKAKCWDWSTSSAHSLGSDAWDFQACTEMVMPMCSRKGNVMFPANDWDFEAYTKECMDKWLVRPRPEMAMTIYGSDWLKAASNIVFSNGDLDPWSGGGVYQNITKNSVYSILIRGGAHHLDLRDSNPADPPAVKEARDFEKERIREWIAQYKGFKRAAAPKNRRNNS
jgi:lysosomal Pro-X carboxypeptidase